MAKTLEVNVKRRRWLQFRLKWLLLFVAVLSAPLSWLGWKLEEKRRERWAEKELGKFSVAIMRNYVADEDPFGRVELPNNSLVGQPRRDVADDDPFGDVESPPPPGPAWLRRLFGDDFFVHVELVYCWESKLDPDINLDHASGPAREGMSDNPPVNDGALVYLRYFPNLRELSLDGSEVTDAGLRHLYSLSRLESLDLKDTKVSAGAAANLRKMLPNCKITMERSSRGR